MPEPDSLPSTQTKLKLCNSMLQSFLSTAETTAPFSLLSVPRSFSARSAFLSWRKVLLQSIVRFMSLCIYALIGVISHRPFSLPYWFMNLLTWRFSVKLQKCCCWCQNVEVLHSYNMHNMSSRTHLLKSDRAERMDGLTLGVKHAQAQLWSPKVSIHFILTLI